MQILFATQGTYTLIDVYIYIYKVMMLCTKDMECDAGVLMCTELCAGI